VQTLGAHTSREAQRRADVGALPLERVIAVSPR